MRALGLNRTKYPDGFSPKDYSFDYFSEFNGKEGLVKMWQQGFGGGEFAVRDRAGLSSASAPANDDMEGDDTESESLEESSEGRSREGATGEEATANWEKRSKPLSLLLNTCLGFIRVSRVGYFSLDGRPTSFSFQLL